MNIDDVIEKIGNMEIKEVRDWHHKATRALRDDPKREDARKLLSAAESELTRRKYANRIHVPPLWWEPHDPSTSEFYGYDARDAAHKVAIIFKSATHTSTRKAVYSVRIGDLLLPERFEKVGEARKAGSEAWKTEADA